MSAVVVIGLGSIGRRHATNLRSLLPDAQLTFLRREVETDGFSNDLSARIVASLEQALDPQPDLVVLATPSALHVDLLPALIESGVPLLIEKPICTTIKDCDRIAGLLEAAPPALRTSGFNFRHVASLQKAREVIRSGQIGKIVRASFKAGQWLPDWRQGTDYRSSYSASRLMGGGVELDLVHEVDVARWFFSDLDLAFSIGAQLSGLEVDCHDVSTMVLIPQDGGPIIDISLDYVARERIRRYEIVGDTGTLVWDIAGWLHLVGPEGYVDIDKSPGGFDIASSYVEMMRSILAADNPSGSALVQDLRDGLRSSRLAAEAAEKGYEK